MPPPTRPPPQSLIAMVVLLQPEEPWKAMYYAFCKAVKAPTSAHERLVDVLVRVAGLEAPERDENLDFPLDLYMREDEVSATGAGPPSVPPPPTPPRDPRPRPGG